MAVTIKDVAREAGVATSTVSKYLNGGHVLGENRKAIEAAIKKLDYRLNMSAHAMRAGNTKTVMLLVPQLNNIFCRELITISVRLMQAKGYAVLTAESNCNAKTENMLLNRAVSCNVDGVIAMPVDVLNPGYRELERHGIPVIVFCPVNKGKDNTNSILFDEMDRTFDLLGMAYRLGHRGIGFILSDVPKMLIETKGITHFNAKLSTTGLHYNNNYVYTGIGNDFDIGVHGTRHLLNLTPRPTLIFCFNQEILAGAFFAVKDAGLRIPEDISLCGTVQDSNLDVPPYNMLTSVAIPMTSGAERAVSMLLQYLNNPEKSRGVSSTVHLSTHLHEGGSLGPAPEPDWNFRSDFV